MDCLRYEYTDCALFASPSRPAQEASVQQSCCCKMTCKCVSSACLSVRGLFSNEKVFLETTHFQRHINAVLGFNLVSLQQEGAGASSGYGHL